MFEKIYEARFSDLGYDGCFKMGSTLNLLQDVSFAHADSAGIDETALNSRGIALLLSGWRVKFFEKLTDKAVTVKTGIMRVGRCEAFRKYEIWQDGICKVAATGIWFSVDTKIRKVCRVPQEYVDAFERIDEVDNGIPFERFLPRDDCGHLQTFTVERRDTDPNRHFNNVKSVEKIMELVPDDFDTAEICIKYRKEVRQGDKVSVFGKETDKGYYFEIRNRDDAVCTFSYVNKK